MSDSKIGIGIIGGGKAGRNFAPGHPVLRGRRSADALHPARGVGQGGGGVLRGWGMDHRLSRDVAGSAHPGDHRCHAR